MDDLTTTIVFFHYVMCRTLANGSTDLLRIAIILMMQPPEWVSENVVKFPVYETLVRFLSEFYYIESTNMDAVNYGLPVGRLRSYTIGRHKLKCPMVPHPLASSLHDFAVLLQRPCNFPWQALWWIDKHGPWVWDNEIDVELMWAGSRASVANPDDEASGHLDPKKRWYRALTPTEQENADIYEVKWPGRAFSLTQSATEHATKSTTKYLQTFIHNFGLLWTWASDPPRWLSASEALAGMGFPVFPPLRSSMHSDMVKLMSDKHDKKPFILTSFDVPRPDRKPQTVRSQCGNSDCLFLAAVGELYGLLNTTMLESKID